MPTRTESANGSTVYEERYRYVVRVRYGAESTNAYAWPSETEGVALARVTAILSRHPMATVRETRTVKVDELEECVYDIDVGLPL